MYHYCKLLYFPLLSYFREFRAVVSACLYVQLSCLHCQTLAAYLMFANNLDDDDDDDVVIPAFL